MDADLYNALNDGAGILFLILIPLLISTSVVGLLSSAIQSATTIKDQASLYGIKLITVVVVLYFVLPRLSESLLSLTQTILSGD